MQVHTVWSRIVTELRLERARLHYLSFGMRRFMYCLINLSIGCQKEKKPIVQSNKYLIPLDVQMYKMRGDNNSVPKLRTSSRTETARSNANNSRRIEDWHGREFGIVWNMDALLRRTSLALCKE